MKIKTNFSYALNYFGEADCRIEKLVEASPEDFKELQISLQDNPLLLKHKDCMYEQDGVCHCLLVLEQEGYDGILVESKGPGYPFYGAYITGMRDVLNGELNRAADFIVRQCMENSGEGNWCVSFNGRPGNAHGYVALHELEEPFGLVIRDGNGLDAMLMDAIRRQPGVTGVELNGGIVETACDLSLHKRQNAREAASAGFPPERAAELFENAVSSALGLYQGEDLYTTLHGSFGLTVQEIRGHGYLSGQELADICHVPQQVLKGGMTVRDVLPLDGLPEDASLEHKNSVFLVPLEDLKLLTDAGKEDFAALLDARVADIRVDEETPELLLEGVEAAELDRLHDKGDFQMKQFTYSITDPIGIHARPAGLLAKFAKTLDSTVTIARGEKSAVATKLMAVMGLGVKTGEMVTITIEGGDEEANTAAMDRFCKENM